MRRRREEFLNENLTSWLNVVPSVQFDPPSYAGGNGNLVDVCFLEKNGFHIYLFLGVTSQNVLIRSFNESIGGAYEGVIRASNNLTNNGVLGNVSFTHSSVVREVRSIQYVVTGGQEYLYVLSLDSVIARFSMVLDLSTTPAVASLTFIDSYQMGTEPSTGTFWFSSDGLKLWTVNAGGTTVREFTFSNAYDLTSFTQTKNLTNFRLASRPYFFANGSYCLGLYRNNDGGTSETIWDLAIYQCNDAYDPTTAVLRYRRPMSRGASYTKLRTSAIFPLFLSNNRREVNWFSQTNASNNANGRIGYGWFNIPFNFRGESQTAESGVRGVKFTDGTYVEPF